MTIKYIDEINLNEKRVLIRVDYNVPYDNEMKITDDTRITATLPTIKYCLEKRSSIILISHLGRPKGKVVPELSLRPVAERLSELLGKEVKFIDKPLGNEVKETILSLPKGEVALLENIRFYPEEEKNEENFGKRLAELGDVYINDAFATAHRGHASNEAITRHISECAAGFLLKDEIEYFKRAITTPERPLIALIGGAKVSSKLNILQNILKKVDTLIIGGGMVFTFLKAKGNEVGKSLLEEDLIVSAKEMLDDNSKGVEILLPVDVVVAPAFENDAPQKVVGVNEIPNNMMGLDIGPESIELFIKKIKNAKTIVWNGPMGAFEMPSFAKGTNEVAKAIAESNSLSIIGGGDSVTAVNKSGLADKMSYISTGGGAFLELLGGDTLPAFAALDR
ncbi:MAG: phosphoglycerate kinase [Spirochaetota bacterium]|nr:phosphoglycerate kinase [Spirochaetota bacterium]